MHSQTSHFRLINALGTRAAEMRLPPEEEHSANRFHKDMFLSGVEKIIAVSAFPFPTQAFLLFFPPSVSWPSLTPTADCPQSINGLLPNAPP